MHNFSMSSILQNTYAVYMCVNDIEECIYMYSEFCTILADELFVLAESMRGYNDDE